MSDRQGRTVRPYLLELALVLAGMVALAAYARATGMDLAINGAPSAERWVLGTAFLLANMIVFVRAAGVLTFTLVPDRWRPNRERTENLLIVAVGVFLGSVTGTLLVSNVV